MFRGIWYCHIDHVLLECSSWYGSTKFLNKFFKSCYFILKICMLNIEKTTQFDSILRHFLIFLETWLVRARVTSCVKCAIHFFPGRNKVFTQYLDDLVVLNFYFYLVPPFYFLKWNRYFSTFLPVLACLIYPLITAESMN